MKMHRAALTGRVLLCLITFLGPTPARSAAARALTLDNVLESVEEHYPLLAAAVEERALADAELLSAQGAFDLRVGARSKLKPEGFYQTYEGGAFAEQPTTLWGAEFFGGYRIGAGNFAIWDGGQETNDGGEFAAGLRLPLLRDGSIDKRRADMRKAEIGVDAADPKVRKSLIAFTREASFAYWNWVAAGLRVSVARELLDVAEERQSQIARRIELGAVAKIDLADNERLIVDRRVLLISTEQAFEQAAIKLSLFLRDANGDPLIPQASQLPAAFPKENRPAVEKLAQDIERAIEQQPVIAELALREEAARVDLELADNQMLPGLGITVGGSKDVGAPSKFPDDKGPAVLEARIEFELPVQRREARGAVAAAESRIRRIEAERRFAADRVAAEVRAAMAGLRAAYEQLSAAQRNVELALELRSAEERKLLLGTSNLINVNIREVQAADAGSTLITAQAAYFRALANYRAALGETRRIS